MSNSCKPGNYTRLFLGPVGLGLSVILVPALFKQDMTNSYGREDLNSAVSLSDKLDSGPHVCLPVPKHSAGECTARDSSMSFTKKSKPSANEMDVAEPGSDSMKKPSRGSLRRKQEQEQKQEARVSSKPKDADSDWMDVEGNSQANGFIKGAIQSFDSKNNAKRSKQEWVRRPAKPSPMQRMQSAAQTKEKEARPAKIQRPAAAPYLSAGVPLFQPLQE